MLKEPGENTIDFLKRALNPLSFRKGSEIGDAALTVTSWAVVGALAGAASALKKGRNTFGGPADTSVVDVDFDPERATHKVDKFASRTVAGVPVEHTLAFRVMGVTATATVAALAAGASAAAVKRGIKNRMQDVKGDTLDREITRTIVDARQDSIDKDARDVIVPTDDQMRDALDSGPVGREHSLVAKTLANAVVLATAAGIAAFGAGAMHGHSYMRSKDKNYMKLEQLKALRDRELGNVDTPVRVNLMGLDATEGGGGDPAAPRVAVYERN